MSAKVPFFVWSFLASCPSLSHIPSSLETVRVCFRVCSLFQRWQLPKQWSGDSGPLLSFTGSQTWNSMWQSKGSGAAQSQATRRCWQVLRTHAPNDALGTEWWCWGSNLIPLTKAISLAKIFKLLHWILSAESFDICERLRDESSESYIPRLGVNCTISQCIQIEIWRIWECALKVWAVLKKQ